MTPRAAVLVALAALAALGAILFVRSNWPSRLESRIALRYLKSRGVSRLVSLITVIAVGGVTVGVMALVIVLGVMNGLQADLRDKILVASPHLRVLTYGEVAIRFGGELTGVGKLVSPAVDARGGREQERDQGGVEILANDQHGGRC